MDRTHHALSYEAPDWRSYVMDWRGDPHPVMESPEQEIEVVDEALRFLARHGVIPHVEYDHDRFLAHRAAVRERFEIPWTGISPRMQRLLYAINAIVEPEVMVAMGIFCGNTFISNAGAAIGPGAVYRAKRLVGIEIVSEEIGRAARNVATVDPRGEAEIVDADGIEWMRDFDGHIDLLYIDANGSYRAIVEQASHGKLAPGSLVLAHNSVNMRDSIADYLDFVRSSDESEVSINVIIDDQGLEVTKRPE